VTGPGILHAARLRPRPGAPMSDSGSESLAPTLRPGRPSSGSVAFDCSRFEGTHFEAAAPAAQKCALPSAVSSMRSHAPIGSCARRHARVPVAVAPHAAAQETRPNPKGLIGPAAPGPLLPLKGCSTASPSTRLAQDGAHPPSDLETRGRADTCSAELTPEDTMRPTTVYATLGLPSLPTRP
jgi:hypothetical protein